MYENNATAMSCVNESSADCGQRVMAIVHDRDLKGILNYALESYGFKAIFCANWEEAFLSSCIREFDYIIAECDVPGSHSSGLERIRSLREQFPLAIIICMSRKDRGMDFLRAGANDFFQIPFVPYFLAMVLDGRDILT